MGAPQTLPADFKGWDNAAPESLPADFDKWDQAAAKTTQPAAPRTPNQKIGDDLTDLIGSAAKSLAKVSGPNVMYELLRKHFPEAKLPPALGMPNEQEVMKQGILMMIPEAEGEAGIAPKAGTTARAPEAAAKASTVLEHPAVSPWVDAAKAEVMKIPGANLAKTLYRSAKGLLGKDEAPPAPTPAPVPETDGIRWGTSSGGPLDQRGKMIPRSEPSPATRTAPAPEAAAEAQPSPAAATPAETPSGAGIPRTLSGDSAVRQVLTGQDNANLLKIARSRGINVTQEAQLKPGVADARIINKIVDDFSPEELQEFRDNYIEQTRMGKHDFGDIGPDAWKTMSMQTYFPDVKIPLARVLKTQKAIATAGAPKFATQSARSIVIDPETGQPEFSDVVAAKKTATAAKPPAAAKAANATDDDLSAILEESVKKAKATRAARASQQ